MQRYKDVYWDLARVTGVSWADDEEMRRRRHYYGGDGATLSGAKMLLGLQGAHRCS